MVFEKKWSPLPPYHAQVSIHIVLELELLQ